MVHRVDTRLPEHMVEMVVLVAEVVEYKDGNLYGSLHDGGGGGGYSGGAGGLSNTGGGGGSYNVGLILLGYRNTIQIMVILKLLFWLNFPKQKN